MTWSRHLATTAIFLMSVGAGIGFIQSVPAFDPLAADPSAAADKYGMVKAGIAALAAALLACKGAIDDEEAQLLVARILRWPAKSL